MAILRRGWPLLIPLLPLLAYGLWWFNPWKPLLAQRRLEEAARRLDAPAVHALCDPVVQVTWDGAWEPMGSLLDRRPLQACPRADEQPMSPGEYLDPADPSHRYLGFFSTGGSTCVGWTRMRWTGRAWIIDGLWRHGCIRSQEEHDWERSLWRIPGFCWKVRRGSGNPRSELRTAV